MDKNAVIVEIVQSCLENIMRDHRRYENGDDNKFPSEMLGSVVADLSDLKTIIDHITDTVPVVQLDENEQPKEPLKWRETAVEVLTETIKEMEARVIKLSKISSPAVRVWDNTEKVYKHNPMLKDGPLVEKG